MFKTESVMLKEGEMKEIKEKHKNDAQTLSKKTMELYKREQVNPFSSLLVIFIQIPIFFALYFVFSKGMHSDPESLYSFVTFPDSLHMKAFGLFDVTQKNIYIALLAGISSYFLARRQTQSMTPVKVEGKEPGFQEQFMKSMQIQMLYVLPVIIVFSGAVLPSALSLYWFVSNVIGYLQDIYMKHKLAHLR
jgi:YidC/Oxa1 family membrane protein insertase